MPKQDSAKPAARSRNSNRPIHTLRHRRIKAAIWENYADKGPIFNITISRSYLEKESGQWRDTQSIGYDDLMQVAALMYEAHAFISGVLAQNAANKPLLTRK